MKRRDRIAHEAELVEQSKRPQLEVVLAEVDNALTNNIARARSIIDTTALQMEVLEVNLQNATMDMERGALQRTAVERAQDILIEAGLIITVEGTTSRDD